MRVTTVIKDYITREVNKKYEEKLNNIPNEYEEQFNEMKQKIIDIAEEANEKAIKIAKEYNMYEGRGNHEIIDYHTYYLGNSDREKERRDLTNKLKEERDNKISQIILDLELGDTKKNELSEILSNIEF